MECIHVVGTCDNTGKHSGYDRSYAYHDEAGRLRWSCDVYGGCITRPTEYRGHHDGDQPFTMTVRGAVLAVSFRVDDHAGRVIGTITRKGIGFRWKMLGEHDEELARVVDSAGWKEATARELLSTSPDCYAVLRDATMLATIRNERLAPRMPRPPRNALGRFVERFIPPGGLTLRRVACEGPPPDVRLLVAALTLVQVHDITGYNQS
jgi:hypothetical protein